MFISVVRLGILMWDSMGLTHLEPGTVVFGFLTSFLSTGGWDLVAHYCRNLFKLLQITAGQMKINFITWHFFLSWKPTWLSFNIFLLRFAVIRCGDFTLSLSSLSIICKDVNGFCLFNINICLSSTVSLVWKNNNSSSRKEVLVIHIKPEPFLLSQEKLIIIQMHVGYPCLSLTSSS